MQSTQNDYWTVLEFSIPMRGNEEKKLDCLSNLLTRFSIPMRGNELRDVQAPRRRRSRASFRSP